MQYLFLLYGDEAGEQAMGAEESKRVMEEHGTFAQRMKDEGRRVSGAGLEASSTATMVRRVADGDDVVTDGPFAESKEQIGGVYLIECADLDDALRVARLIPMSPGLAVEVRPAPY